MYINSLDVIILFFINPSNHELRPLIYRDYNPTIYDYILHIIPFLNYVQSSRLKLQPFKSSESVNLNGVMPVPPNSLYLVRRSGVH